MIDQVCTSTRSMALQTSSQKRILLLNGAMGTMSQFYKLEELDYRADCFIDPPFNLKDNIWIGWIGTCFWYLRIWQKLACVSRDKLAHHVGSELALVSD